MLLFYLSIPCFDWSCKWKDMSADLWGQCWSQPRTGALKARHLDGQILLLLRDAMFFFILSLWSLLKLNVAHSCLLFILRVVESAMPLGYQARAGKFMGLCFFVWMSCSGLEDHFEIACLHILDFYSVAWCTHSLLKKKIITQRTTLVLNKCFLVKSMSYTTLL